MKRFERSHKMGIGVSLRAAFLFLAVMLFALDVSAQSTISGKVVDTNGEEIISATVLVKGSLVPHWSSRTLATTRRK